MAQKQAVRTKIAVVEADVAEARADAIRAVRIILSRRVLAATETEGTAAQLTQTRPPRPVITA